MIGLEKSFWMIYSNTHLRTRETLPLKEDLSIDTTFDPCYFSWDSPFKKFLERDNQKIRGRFRYLWLDQWQSWFFYFGV